MPRRKTTPNVSTTRFQIGDPVSTVNSKYSSVPNKLIGYIESVLNDGSYAVYYRRTAHIHLFGGSMYRKEAIMYMTEAELTEFKPTERQIGFIKELVMFPRLSLTRAKEIYPGREEPLKSIKVEDELDDLWDAGIVICLGDFHLDENGLYQYTLTAKGNKYAQRFA